MGLSRLVSIGGVVDAIRRPSISTRVITTSLVVGVALAWGRVSEWCGWWQVAYVATALLAIGLLVMREVNRARIKDRRIREALDELKESARASAEEARNELTAKMHRLRRDLLREFSEARRLQERALEASDPSYERPKVVNLTASMSSDDPQVHARPDGHHGAERSGQAAAVPGPHRGLAMPPAPNFANRTVWTGDYLDILRGLNSETVDLIYLDPPFNSNRTYAAPIGSQAAGAAFKDTWTLSDLDVAWLGLIADEHPALYKVIETGELAHGKGMQSYLTMVAVRLLEMRRLLKPTGSMYLHCDPTASHYLKSMMDSIFGPDAFRSEVVWKSSSAHSDARQGRRQHGPIHDILLFYTTPDRWTWHLIHTPYDKDYIDQFYRHIEPETGRRYRLDNLTGPGGAAKGNPQYELMGVMRYWRYSQERMAELIAAGRVVQSRPGAVPAYKRYLDEMPGVPLQDMWTDIRPIGSRTRERVGYPTQKPLELLEHIITASSNPGDVVLDPLCGCATACVAAEKLDRRLVGIDLSPKAAELVLQRLDGPEYGALFRRAWITVRTDIPQRTDIDAPINYRKRRHELFGQQEGRCSGCRHEFPFRNFTVDHVIPRSKGDTDHLSNLQPLCGACNSVKGDRTQEYLIAQLKSHAHAVL